MRKQKTNSIIRKGEKYGVYNVTDCFVEFHHRSEKAAINKMNSRKTRAPKGTKFEIVELI